MKEISPLRIEIGVKSDPIEYRYSFEWLFRILADEDIHHLQLGTFFELYQLPDAWFLDLRRRAADHGVEISSVFTAHRELGGFFRNEPGWEETARRNFTRLVEVAGLAGARHAGSNPGAVMRDEMGTKHAGTARYLRHFKELLHYAPEHGVSCLTIEPMSCLAEPPTTAGEISAMGMELEEYVRANPGTARAGFCIDTSHGWADRDGIVRETPEQLMTTAMPWTAELHLKNTDALFNSTFGFGEAERERGIVDLAKIRDLYLAHATVLPSNPLHVYLEIGGPKLGRDYSDCKLEGQLRASLNHIKDVFRTPAGTPQVPRPSIELAPPPPAPAPSLQAGRIMLSPSLMCADLLHFEDSVRALEDSGAELLHIDVMDAHFTPNMPLGLEVFKRLRPKTATPFDAHLMVDINDFFVERMAEIGAWMVSVHLESCIHAHRTLGRIRSLGMKAGAALNPATPLNHLEYLLEQLDFVLIMTVNPGYAGQALVPNALRKITDCRKWLDARGAAHIPIEVDGNVSFGHIEAMTAAGADILVAGTSSVYHPGGTLRGNMARTRELAEKGLGRREKTAGGAP